MPCALGYRTSSLFSYLAAESTCFARKLASLVQIIVPIVANCRLMWCSIFELGLDLVSRTSVALAYAEHMGK